MEKEREAHLHKKLEEEEREEEDPRRAPDVGTTNHRDRGAGVHESSGTSGVDHELWSTTPASIEWQGDVGRRGEECHRLNECDASEEWQVFGCSQRGCIDETCGCFFADCCHIDQSEIAFHKDVLASSLQYVGSPRTRSLDRRHSDDLHLVGICIF